MKYIFEKETYNELADFGTLAEKSFDFWDNPEDDIYDRFYNKNNNILV